VVSVARIELGRHVAADPSSLALLLSGPTGRDLWGDNELTLAAPQRSGVGFRVDVATSGPVPSRGRILIFAGADGPIASEVRLTLSTVSTEVPTLRRAAETFLDALGTAAQERSSAA
jgi:hypothetical protein